MHLLPNLTYRWCVGTHGLGRFHMQTVNLTENMTLSGPEQKAQN